MKVNSFVQLHTAHCNDRKCPLHMGSTPTVKLILHDRFVEYLFKWTDFNKNINKAILDNIIEYNQS